MKVLPKTAKLAKQCAYNEPHVDIIMVNKLDESRCFLGNTLQPNEEAYGKMSQYIAVYKNTLYGLFRKEHKMEIYAAPTQSELQTWIRNTHKLHPAIEILHDDSKQDVEWVFSSIEHIGNKKAIINWHIQTLPTYESALEVGLIEMLKIIKKRIPND
jgi:hypothetical protein